MNKPIFENEEETGKFIAEFILPYFKIEEITSELRNRILKNYKTNGLIKQSELEKAKNCYYKEFVCDENEHAVQTTIYNYIKELEKEIERKYENIALEILLKGV